MEKPDPRKPCVHGNKPAATCKKCERDRQRKVEAELLAGQGGPPPGLVREVDPTALDTRAVEAHGGAQAIDHARASHPANLPPGQLSGGAQALLDHVYAHPDVIALAGTHAERARFWTCARCGGSRADTTHIGLDACPLGEDEARARLAAAPPPGVVPHMGGVPAGAPLPTPTPLPRQPQGEASSPPLETVNLNEWMKGKERESFKTVFAKDTSAAVDSMRQASEMEKRALDVLMGAPHADVPKTAAGKFAVASDLLAGGFIGEEEDDEEIPEEALVPPDGASGGNGPEQAWGRTLPGAVRLSSEYRLAIYREGEDYRLVEMVREGGVWRERILSPEPEGFDVVESRLLAESVENMSP